jgi:hypothetical protein
MARIKSRFHACDLGPLPVEIVGRLLRCTLAPGIVHFSTANQDHAFERHGAEYLACFPHIAVTVLAPEYIGQSPHHSEGFEMVRAIEELSDFGGSVLVALTLEIDEAQRYMVQSVYPINRSAVFRRLRKGYLFPVG